MYNISNVCHPVLVSLWVVFSMKSYVKCGEENRRLCGFYVRRWSQTLNMFGFIAASLGEFEQGRPLIEQIRKDYPQYKILLTFFSPSGYEVRKNYEGADIITYLPIDTVGNARRFLRAVLPVMAFFIKYEFWYNYLHILQYRDIPVYSVSSIFRPDQIFFKWYGRGYGRVLKWL